MTVPAEELVQALALLDSARVELSNAASASKATAASFLGDADRMLIDANAAVWRACNARGWSAPRIPDSASAGTADPRRAAAALLPQVDAARAEVDTLLRAARSGTAPAAPGGVADAEAAAARPATAGGDPFGTPEIFDPKNSAKYVTRRRGLGLLALGIVLAALGAVIGFGTPWLSEDFSLFWLGLPIPGLVIAGRGIIELLHARDM